MNATQHTLIDTLIMEPIEESIEEYLYLVATPPPTDIDSSPTPHLVIWESGIGK